VKLDELDVNSFDLNVALGASNAGLVDLDDLVDSNADFVELSVKVVDQDVVPDEVLVQDDSVLDAAQDGFDLEYAVLVNSDVVVQNDLGEVHYADRDG
jgi:hypothetical protein